MVILQIGLACFLLLTACLDFKLNSLYELLFRYETFTLHVGSNVEVP